MKALLLTAWFTLSSMTTIPNEGPMDTSYAMKITTEESRHVMKEFGLFVKETELIKMYPAICPIPTVDGTYVSSYYGSRVHPIYKARHIHRGIDIAAPKDTPVVATGHGKVTGVKLRGGYGRQIMIEHMDGYMTRYAHLNEILVNKGDIVKQGDIIGTVGTTGLSTGNHLHYEIILNNEVIDPLFILPDTLHKNAYLDYSRKLNNHYKARSDLLFNI